MISSRWPRPIGISASIALRPVAIGSCTDLRGMMPGALTSTRARCSVAIGPLPSIGLPSASTTRPSSPLPIGTSTMARVRLTVSPSPMSRSEPKITMPTLSLSRLSAMPRMPPGNSTISPIWTLSSPWTRAMPSPTERTWPTSETSASWPKFLICSFRMAEISAARISISRPLSWRCFIDWSFVFSEASIRRLPIFTVSPPIRLGIDLDVERTCPCRSRA